MFSADRRWSDAVVIGAGTIQTAHILAAALSVAEYTPAGPAGRRAPAEPHGRAHAAGRSRGELLVPPPPRGVRVDRRARPRPRRRRHGLRRGLRQRRARLARRARDRRRRQPRGARARARRKYTKPGVALRARPRPDLEQAGRRRRLPPDDRARRGPGRDPRALQAHPAAGRRRVRVDAERADARARGRREVRQSLAHQGVPAEEYIDALRGALRARRDARPLPHPQAEACTSWRSERGWDDLHPKLGITKPFYDWFVPAISARDFVLRPAAARPRAGLPRRSRDDPATAGRWRSSCTRTCRTSRASAPGRSARSGCGRRWRRCTCRCSRVARRGADHGRADAGAVRPARGHRRRGRRPAPDLPDRDAAARAYARRRRARRSRGRRAAARGGRLPALLSTAGSSTRSGRSTGSSCGPSCATHAVLPLLATESGLRLQIGAGVASHLERFGGAWRGGFWLPECAYSPGLERDADRARRARLLRRPDRRRSGSARSTTWSRCGRPPGRSRCRSTGRRSLWSGARTATRRAPTTAPTRAGPSTTCGPGTSPAASTTTRRALRSRASTRAISSPQSAPGSTTTAPRAGAPGSSAARVDTELLGHWWYEGVGWLRAVIDECAAQGVPLLTAGRRARGHRAGRARPARARRGASRRT